MIRQLIRAFMDGSDIDVANLLTQLAASAFVIIFCLSVHECAHAWAAKKLGDNTAWMHGRLTLNPSRHLDLIGTLMILVVGFGYAKPVPVNPRKFRDRKKGMALTAAAGPLSNLIMAFGLLLLAYAFDAVVSIAFGAARAGDLYDVILRFLSMSATSNVGLMLFNLIPVPPLDGSRILDMLLPARASFFLARNERYFSWGLYALLFFGVLNTPLGYLVYWVTEGLHFLAGLPFFWVEAVL
jgi:Zn-dependent protease